MAIGQVYQGKLFTTAFGETQLNVFHFLHQVEGSQPYAGQLWSGFVNNIIPALKAVCSVLTTFSNLEIVNVPSPEDFFVDQVGGTGAVTGQAYPANAVWTFRYNRIIPGQRNGYKRFGVIPESLAQGPFTDATALALLDTLANALETPIVEAGNTWAPFVAKRPVQLGINPSGYVCTDVSRAGIGSQASRKKPLAP